MDDMESGQAMPIDFAMSTRPGAMANPASLQLVVTPKAS